jgi:hypothetical protein
LVEATLALVAVDWMGSFSIYVSIEYDGEKLEVRLVKGADERTEVAGPAAKTESRIAASIGVLARSSFE